MSQHDFNIANQSFPATRTDLNNALAALASNSSGDTEPTTTYANQFWYETDTNILKIRNEANNGWVDVITLDASMTAAASELNQLDAITRGSILYGDASGATARLAKGAADTVLTSDGTDISWAAAGGGGVTLPTEPTWSSPSVTITSSGTYTLPGTISDSDYVWFLLTGSGGSGMSPGSSSVGDGGGGANTALIICQGAFLNSGKTYTAVIASGVQGGTSAFPPSGGTSTLSNFLASDSSTSYQATGGVAGGQAGLNGDRGAWTVQSGQTNIIFIGASAVVNTNFISSIEGSFQSTTNNFFPGGGLSIGNGGGDEQSSIYGGDGGSAPGGNGSVPGGGSGGAANNTSLPGLSGAGNLRIYY